MFGIYDILTFRINPRYGEAVFYIQNSLDGLRSLPVSFQGDLFPQLPHMQNWIFGVILFLFVLFVFSVNRSYGWIVDSLQNIAKVKIRKSMFSQTTTEGYQSRFFLIIFAVGILSLYVYLGFYPSAQLSFSIYFLLFLCSLIFLIVKHFLMRVVAYTFSKEASFKSGDEFYTNTLFFLSLLVAPLLILKIYFCHGTFPNLFDIIASIFAILSAIFLVIKLFQLFYKKILDSIHILLYLCALEILPYIGLFQVYKWIIKGF
ncbi:MAG TPA: DUF4271 domain-containing protein [Paludibacter sp.]|jgi:hypothetical protein|nr:DUF4271 domain-containing protein [Paludibacter sp.]HOS46269.1 DUF4271 domain-containing protein [Paludibacter sp.]HPM08852.1 DUF4271 domain-containing protein [Paludibacter sp.]